MRAGPPNCGMVGYGRPAEPPYWRQTEFHFSKMPMRPLLAALALQPPPLLPGRSIEIFEKSRMSLNRLKENQSLAGCNLVKPASW